MDSAKISKLELFEIDIPHYHHIHLGTLANCRFGILKISYAGQEGQGNCMMCTEAKTFDLIRWGNQLRYITGHTLEDAVAETRVKMQNWPERNQFLLAQMALHDVKARLEKMQPPEIIRNRYFASSAAQGAANFKSQSALAVLSDETGLEKETEAANHPELFPGMDASLLGWGFPTENAALIRISSAYYSMFKS